jgi:(p)ppGpp synthase/HD superfamily hydrolase
MSTLNRAIEIALEVHATQVDKAGDPYILHPLRVMLSLKDPDDRVVAVLHDVLEDGRHLGWISDRLLAEGFSARVVDALLSVSKAPDEEDARDDSPEVKTQRYLRFVERAGRNPIGRRVKLADLRDNMDLTRIANPTEKDFRRLEKYRKAVELLEALPQDAR